MTQQYAWQESYSAAMLELDAAKLTQRIAQAQDAIAKRLNEIKNDGMGLSVEERLAMADAQQNLRALLRTVNLSNDNL